MKGSHYVTLEELGYDSSLDVEIVFEYTPGEPMVMYYPDGSGYPGSDSSVEFISASVQVWYVGNERRKRGSSWVWESLDRISGRVISDDWERFTDGCLESMAERMEEDREDD